MLQEFGLRAWLLKPHVGYEIRNIFGSSALLHGSAPQLRRGQVGWRSENGSGGVQRAELNVAHDLSLDVGKHESEWNATCFPSCSRCMREESGML